MTMANVELTTVTSRNWLTANQGHFQKVIPQSLHCGSFNSSLKFATRWQVCICLTLVSILTSNMQSLRRYHRTDARRPYLWSHRTKGRSCIYYRSYCTGCRPSDSCSWRGWKSCRIVLVLDVCEVNTSSNQERTHSLIRSSRGITGIVNNTTLVLPWVLMKVQGVGGEYPASSTSASEAANEKMTESRGPGADSSLGFIPFLADDSI